MIKDNRNNEQIYGRNDMIMLDPNNKIYGSLGLADNYVMKTEEGTRLVLSNPKLGKFGDVLTEFNMYGKSEQKQYKGINLFPPDTEKEEYVEVSIPKGSLVFWTTDGIPAKGGNFRFFNEDKTENMWFGIDSGTTSKRMTLTIDAKYVQNLINEDFDLSKICLGVGNEPIYEPYTGGIPSPSPDYPQEIKRVVNPIVKVTNEDGTQFETVTLPYTLNAIPVEREGNVTIDGQQYIADYIDVGHGKLVKTVYEYVFSGKEKWRVANDGAKYIEYNIIGDNGIMDSSKYKKCLCSCLVASTMHETRNSENHISTQVYSDRGIQYNNRVWVSSNVVTSKLVGEKAFLALAVPKEISLTQEEIEQYKKLSIKIPVTIVENNYNTWMKATYKSIESV